MTTQVPAADISATSERQLERILSEAAAAARPLRRLAGSDRAGLLRCVADALDAAGPELVPIAEEESHLPAGRLRGELGRTTFQLRLFADVLEDGSYLEAMIDTADPDWGMGPRPDLRRMLVPLGPVVVFAASNFPFAFSVAGGDTASALAAGCPVVLKAHSGHPRLSRRTGEIVVGALADAGAPSGSFATIFGTESGVTALRDGRVKAGSFTGSIPAGRRLFEIASTRPEPIPFYGELGSLNPAFVTPRAAARRGDEIARGFVASFTLGSGQFCTKPGFLFLPRGHDLESAIVDAARDVEPASLLNPRIAEGYADAVAALLAIDGVQTLLDGSQSGLVVSPTIVRADVSTLRAGASELLEERFGPAAVLVDYDGWPDVVSAAELFGGNLTATIHGDEAEAAELEPLLEVLGERAGRLVWNGWPTGVSVTHAMHHGGPWPATTASIHTSVGTTAIRRFLRPLSFQDMPDPLLPGALRDGNPLAVPQRIHTAGGRP